MFHHDQDRMDTARDVVTENCRQIIEKNMVNLECFAVYEPMAEVCFYLENRVNYLI